MVSDAPSQLALALPGDDPTSEIGGTTQPSRPPAPHVGAPGGPRALRERVLEAVGSGVGQLDALCEALSTPAPELLTEITTLLIEGLLEEPTPGLFSTHPTEGKP